MNKLFLKIGDTFISETENLHFHRGMKYEVSKCFQHEGGILAFMKDKHGFDVPFDIGRFTPTAATLKVMNERMFETRILFFWKNSNTFLHCKSHQYNFAENDFYEISKAHFLSDRNAIASIRKYRLDPTTTGGYKYFYDDSAAAYIYKIEDVFTYFKNVFKDITNYNNWDYIFHLPGINFETQKNIDYLMYLSEQRFPNFDQCLVNLPEVINTENHFIFNSDFKEFFNYLAQLIFDKKEIDLQIERDLITDIINLFKELPSSHGSTSVSKFLMGKSKVKNSNVESYFGKYKTLMRYDQLFELTSSIETYLFHKNIFTTKEEYGSAKEHRGAFEYIGNKYINEKELEVCLQQLK